MPFFRKRRFLRRRRPIFRRRVRRTRRYGRRSSFRRRPRFRRYRRLRTVRAAPEYKQGVFGTGGLINVTNGLVPGNITTGLGVGINANNRIGDQVRLRKLVMLLRVYASVIVLTEKVRVTIYQLKQLTTDLPFALTDLYDDMDGQLSATEALTFGKRKPYQKWKILWSKQFTLSSIANATAVITAGTGGQLANHPGRMEFYRRITLRWPGKGLPVRYATTGLLNERLPCNQLYFHAASPLFFQGPAQQPTYHIAGRFYFTDE